MFFLLFLMLFSCAVQGAESASHQSSLRDLIILLDDRVETNPGKIGAIVTDLQNALQAEAAPILMSASLWRTFILARQEWMLQAQIPGTAEYKVTTLMQTINERINYWQTLLRGALDDIHTRSLVADKVNAEFYIKERYEQLQADGLIPQNLNALKKIYFCMTTPCSFDAWYWFYLDTGYYLALPKKYSVQYTRSTELTDVLTTAGFNTALTSCAIDPLDIAPTMECCVQSVSADATIVATLQQLFQKKSVHKWSIFITGHGSYYQLMQGYNQEIVGVSLDTFKKVCDFFDANLSTHLLWIVSCKAGGVNRLVLTEGGKVYQYPIVIECLSDVNAYTNLDVYNFLPNGTVQCEGCCLKKNSIHNRWELSAKPSQRFNEFFKKIHDTQVHDLHGDCVMLQEQVCAAFGAISPHGDIANTPQLLLPQSCNWLLCYSYGALYLNTQSALIAEVCNVPHILGKQTIFIDAPVFMSEWKIADKAARYIMAITPGDSIHYCTAVSAHSLTAQGILECFWPYDYPACTKQFLFDTITCLNDPQDPFAQMLGLTENTAVFNQVILQVIKDDQIVVMFTTPAGDSFTAVMRKIDGGPVMRNLQKLSVKAAESYHQYYEKTKTKLLNSAAEAYAPLRTTYATALGKTAVAE